MLLEIRKERRIGRCISHMTPRPMSKQSATLVRSLTRRLRRKKIGKVAQMTSVTMESTIAHQSA